MKGDNIRAVGCFIITMEIVIFMALLLCLLKVCLPTFVVGLLYFITYVGLSMMMWDEDN